jgi:hypothetical protein
MSREETPVTLTPADYARRALGDALFEVMLRRTGPTPACIVLRALPESLHVAPQAARGVLEQDPRFSVQQGKFDLLARGTLTGSNFNRSVEALIADLGRPIPIPEVADFMAGLGGHDSAYYTELLSRLIRKAEVFCEVDGKVIPRSWLLFPEGDSEDDVLFYCDLDGNEEIAALRSRCSAEGLRGANCLETAVNLVRAARQPISNRVLGFFVYRLHPADFDPLELLRGMLAEERLYAEPGLYWVPGDVRAGITAALELLNKQAGTAEKAAGPNLDELLAEELPPDHPGYFIDDDNLALVYEIMNVSTQPVTVLELVTEVLGLTPDSPHFLAAAHSVRALLRDDPNILEVGPTTFAGAGATGGE